MAKLDENIYGADSGALASRIADEALSSTAGSDDHWGEAVDQSALSHGGSSSDMDDQPAKIIRPITNDSRAKSDGN